MANQTAFDLNLNDAQATESAYRQAVREGRGDEFTYEIVQRYSDNPDNLLLSAWYYRLQTAPASEPRPRQWPWRLVVPFSLALSLILWLLSADVFGKEIPWLFVSLWGPITACVLIVFFFMAERSTQAAPAKLSISNPSHYARPLLTVLVIAIIALATYVTGKNSSGSVQTLLVLHLPVLCILAVGLYMAWPFDDQNTFACIHKWAEVALIAGVMAGAVMAFDAITIGLFSAIRIELDPSVMRWLIIGMLGLIPVLVFSVTYMPEIPILEQRFEVAKLILNIARLFLPLTIVVGAVYIASIPANFFQPFQQRDVLIVYNLMLFAVMALLCLATPLHESDVPDRLRTWLRLAILIVAVMAMLVSLYALSATVYRTALGGITINRLTIIGWNVLNIAILGAFLALQIRSGRARWIPSMQHVARIGLIGYAAWSLFIVLAIPVLRFS